MTKKPISKKKTGGKVTMAEIKRQLAAAKLESSNLKRELAAVEKTEGKR